MSVVVLAADPARLDALRAAIARDRGIVLVGTAGDTTAAGRLARRLHPDAVLLDDSLDITAADPVRVLARRLARVPLVLSTADPARAEDALAAGAWGVVLRDGSGEGELCETIAAAAAALRLPGATALAPGWHRAVGILLTTGAATVDQLADALSGRPPAESPFRTLADVLGAEAVAQAAARAARTPRLWLRQYPHPDDAIHPHEWRLVASRPADPVDHVAVGRLPDAFCRERTVLLAGTWRQAGVLAMADPFDDAAKAAAEERSGLRLRAAVATEAEILGALDHVRSSRVKPDPHHLARPRRERMAVLALGGSVLAWILFVALIFFDEMEAAKLPVFLALVCGSLLLAYAAKYYIAVAAVVGASARRNGGQPPPLRLPAGRQPFVSIHVALYNEARVVDRLLHACTALDYANYEVIVADDSTDETVEALERWRGHPRVRVLHRDERRGFKGGALQNALRATDPRAGYVLVLDADFVPGPAIVSDFLAYFVAREDPRLAAVQGYQWHVLNAGENWISRGVRAEFSGSYVLERASQELFGTMKMIAGSVYMVRADVLRTFGWSTSITEDWELTIRLYLGGYRVLYTPYVQAPAECVADLRQLIRQRMRWAEGHTFNVKKYWLAVFLSTRLSLREKLEFFYYAAYYLQATLFTVGTASWLIGVYLLGERLGPWNERLGWSLVLTNLFALPLLNTVGLLFEGSLRRDGLGVLSGIALSYILAPFQAIAAVRGLVELDEGQWHRTRKSGRVTERLAAFDLARILPWELPEPRRRRRATSGIATLGLVIATAILLMGVLSLRAIAGVK